MLDDLYSMTDGIYSPHALIKRNLSIVSEIKDVYMKDRIHNI